MNIDLTRRQAIISAAAASATSLHARGEAPSANPGPFAHGVASGDPDYHSLILWTRVSGFSRATTVSWELATDPESRPSSPGAAPPHPRSAITR